MAFRIEYGRDRITVALANDHHHLALAIVIASQTAILAIFLEIGGLDVAADRKISDMISFHF